MSSTLLALHAADGGVAFSPLPRTAADLLRDVARVSAVLPPARPGSHVLLAVHSDDYHFAVAMLASWAAGHAVALAPVDQPREAFLHLAQRSEISAVLHDTFSGAAIRIDRVLQQASDAGPLPPSELSANDLGVTFYDSASTPLALRRSQLLEEAADLARAAGLPARARTCATVSPETRHGLLLGLLWPLLSGGAFARRRATRLDDARILITSPAHLRVLLRASPQLSAAELHVVSDGGPVPEVARARLAGHVHDLGNAGDQRALLEEQIAWQEGIADAAVLELSPTRRMLLVAADGCDERTLPEGFERVLVLPSDAPALRRGASGEHVRARLLRALDLTAAGSPLAFELELHAQQVESDRAVYRIHVPATYVYFEGHFPGHPILPGAAQLSEMVLPCVRRARPELGPLTRMTRIKFQERIKPDELIDVALTFPSDRQQVDFALRRGETLCAAGRLSFASKTSESQP
jgi:hypothetical protein